MANELTISAALQERGIDAPTWSALQNSIFPGAKPESIMMAIDYCHARGLDVLLKPIHLVPMSVKDAATGKFEFRDVPMPGIGLYRIQATRTNTYAGADAPEFGPMITKKLGGEEVTFPEWCKYTVYKLIGDRVVAFSATEYWEENYATKGRDNQAPNAMWAKRPRGQLAKCAEAQALRKGWPEVGQDATAEEMSGKEMIDGVVLERQTTAITKSSIASPSVAALPDRITENEISQIMKAAEAAGVDAEYICKKGKVANIEDIEKSRFNAVMNHLRGLPARTQKMEAVTND